MPKRSGFNLIKKKIYAMFSADPAGFINTRWQDSIVIMFCLLQTTTGPTHSEFLVTDSQSGQWSRKCGRPHILVGYFIRYHYSPNPGMSLFHHESHPFLLYHPLGGHLFKVSTSDFDQRLPQETNRGSI